MAVSPLPQTQLQTQTQKHSSIESASKTLYVIKPLVIMIGISDYDDCKDTIPNKSNVVNNYNSVKLMLNDIHKYDIIYQNGANKLIHYESSSSSSYDNYNTLNKTILQMKIFLN